MLGICACSAYSMSLRQQAIRGMVWSLIQRWGGQAITFVVFLLLARLLEVKAFGLVALGMVFVGFVQVFTDQGFWDAIIQRPELDQEYLDTAFWVNIVIATLLTLGTVAAAGIIAGFFEEPALAPVLRWLSLSFLVNALSSVQDALLTRDMKFRVLAIRELLGIFAGGIAGVTMALFGLGVWSLVGKQLISAGVNVVVLWKVGRWRPGFRISLIHCSDLFSYGVNVVGLRMLSFLNRRSGEFLIGYFLGSVALGYYTIAYRILSIFVDVMVGAIQKLAFPVFSRLQHDSAKLRQVLFEAIEFTTLVAFPVFLGLCVLTPEIVVVAFGEKWTPSIPILQALALMGLVSAMLYYNDPILMAVGKPQLSLRLTGLSTVLNLTFLITAVRWGITAVAVAYVIRGYLMLPIMVRFIKKIVPFNWSEYCYQFIVPLIAALLMASGILGAKYIVKDTLSVRVLLPLYILFGVAMYGITITVIAPNLMCRVYELFRDALPSSVARDRWRAAIKYVETIRLSFARIYIRTTGSSARSNDKE